MFRLSQSNQHGQSESKPLSAAHASPRRGSTTDQADFDATDETT
jgi:hypothetical protein